MKKALDFLKGKKTYIISAVALTLAGLMQFGVISHDQYNAIIGFLAPVGVFTLRAGMKNENN